MAVASVWNGTTEQSVAVTVWDGTSELAVSSVDVYGYMVDTRPVYVCPIDPSDGRDVTVELTAWLAGLPPNCVADLGGRSYRSETFIKLTAPQGLTIQNGTLTRTDRISHGGVVYPKANPHLWLLSAVNCSVKDLTIRGTNTITDGAPGFGSYFANYEFEAGIRMERTTNCSVVGLDADAVWGDGVQWHGGSGVYMADSVIDRNGRQGVTINASHVLIENVQILHSRRSGMDMEPNLATEVFTNIEVRYCFLNSRLLPFASKGRGVLDDVYLHHNTSDGTSVPVFSVGASDGSRRSDYRFEYHTALRTLGSSVAAVRFDRIDNLRVFGCNLPVASNRSLLAVGMNECSGVCDIVGNNFGGGIYYTNTAPLTGQTLTVASNISADPQEQVM